jgi:hypothetical protein
MQIPPHFHSLRTTMSPHPLLTSSSSTAILLAVPLQDLLTGASPHVPHPGRPII